MLSLLICCVILVAYIIVLERKNKHLSLSYNEIRDKLDKLSGGDFSG